MSSKHHIRFPEVRIEGENDVSPRDYEEAPRKRAKLNDNNRTERFAHRRPVAHPGAGLHTSDMQNDGNSSFAGGILKSVRNGDEIIQYEASPVVLEAGSTPALMQSSHKSHHGSAHHQLQSLGEFKPISAGEEFAELLAHAGAPSGAAPEADEIIHIHEEEAEYNVAGDFAPVSVGSRTAHEIEAHNVAKAAAADSTSLEDSLRLNVIQDDLLDEFIPLSNVIENKNKSKRRSADRPTTPGGKNPLSDKYLAAFNNDNAPNMQLPPWSSAPYQKGHWCLSDEIKDFVKWVAPTPAERAMRRDLLNRVKSVILKTFPRSDPHVFGSCATDLFLPLSDVDFVILGVNPSSHTLRTLADAFVRDGVTIAPQVIDRAKVPIVKFVDAKTGIQVDVSFNQENGLHNTQVVQGFLKEYDALRPLVLVLKHFMQSRDLQEPYTGGIGSYALTLMIVSFLQQQAHHEGGKPERNLGYLLIDFFDFYGYAFNFYTTGISVRKGGFYFNKLHKDWYDHTQPFLLAIEDPNDETNDVGRPSFRVPVVRMAFQESYQRLTNHPKDSLEYAPTLLSRIIHPLSSTERARSYWTTTFTSMVTEEDKVDGWARPPKPIVAPPKQPQSQQQPNQRSKGSPPRQNRDEKRDYGKRRNNQPRYDDSSDRHSQGGGGGNNRWKPRHESKSSGGRYDGKRDRRGGGSGGGGKDNNSKRKRSDMS